MTKRQAIQGYTLIEVMIALAVFAILSTISASMLMQAFNTKTHLDQEHQRIAKLQLAIALLKQDIEQAMDRSIRGNEMRLFPPFIGESYYTEFTRGGFVNPNATTRNSTLKRVGYLCQNNTLTRRSWLMLDSPSRKEYQDKILLTELTECSFSYLSRSRELLKDWRPYALQQNQKNQSLPAAIQVNLGIQHLGAMKMMFIIPEALYGA